MLTEKKEVKDLKGLKHIEFYSNPEALLVQKADILVLAGPGRSINKDNCKEVKVKLIAEGSNIVYTDPSLRDITNQMGILSIPGIIANSGG